MGEQPSDNCCFGNMHKDNCVNVVIPSIPIGNAQSTINESSSIKSPVEVLVLTSEDVRLVPIKLLTFDLIKSGKAIYTLSATPQGVSDPAMFRRLTFNH